MAGARVGHFLGQMFSAWPSLIIKKPGTWHLAVHPGGEEAGGQGSSIATHGPCSGQTLGAQLGAEEAE